MKKQKSIFLVLFISSLLFVSCNEDPVEEEVTLLPEVEFSYSPEAPSVGDEVAFTANPTGNSSEIAAWSWDFGESASSTSNVKNAFYTYTEEGTYEVTLSVTDVDGVTAEVSKSVTVLAEVEEGFPAEIAWTFSVGTEVTKYNDGSSKPAIGDDGTIYYLEGFAKANSILVAVTDNGAGAEKKWETNLGADQRSAPTIGPDGNIFTNAWLGDAMFKLNATNGNTLWNAATAGGVSNSTAAVDSKGNAYVGTRAGGVFAWDPNGIQLWNLPSPDGSKSPYYSSPVLSQDESTLYILMTAGRVAALSTADGSETWTLDVSSGLGSSLSVDSDGTVYVTTETEVVAVSADGTQKWSYAVEGANESGVVIGPNGDLYTGSSTGLVALNADGSEKWVYSTFVAESVPAVDINGNIYVGSGDGNFHIVSPEGEVVKVFELGDSVVNSPVIADDGTVYVEAMKNFNIQLYKITVEGSAPADSPWPMKGQNKKNTGNAADSDQ